MEWKTNKWNSRPFLGWLWCNRKYLSIYRLRKLSKKLWCNKLSVGCKPWYQV